MVPVPRRVRYDVFLQYAEMAVFIACKRFGAERRMVLVVIVSGFFFKFISFCFVVAIFDLVHDVEAMYDIYLYC